MTDRVVMGKQEFIASNSCLKNLIPPNFVIQCKGKAKLLWFHMNATYIYFHCALARSASLPITRDGMYQDYKHLLGGLVQ